MTITQETVPTTKRIEYIDALRGFTMFLVVFMHVADWCLNVNGGTVEYSFHRYLGLVRMPMFFLISGFVLYKEGVTWDIGYIIKFFKKKIPVQLIGPFIFFAAYVCVNNYSLKDSIFDGPKYGYWFTFVLFEYFVFYAIVRFLVRSWWADVILLLMGICFYPCSWPPIMDAIPIPNYILEFLSFKHWHYFIFFVLGTLLKKHFDVAQTWLDGKWLLPFCILFFFLVCAFSKLIPINGVIKAIPLHLTGLVILFSFFRNKQALFSHETKLGRVSQYVGRRTLDIYLIHDFLLPVNLTFVTVFIDHPMPIIEAFVSMCIAIIIIAASLLIGNVIRLSPFLAHWFFGVKRA